MEIEHPEGEDFEKTIPLLCEVDRKPFAIPKNLGPCITQGCTKPTKYACPKCKCNYCSLDCYKNHNETCVNQFYEENVKEELKNRKADEKTQKQMRQMLKDYKDQLDKDREDYEIPEQQLERLEELEEMMNQNELDLDCLTIEEQREFADFIKNNALLQKYLKPWNAWWLTEEGLFSLYVEEIETEQQQSQQSTKKSKKDEEIMEVVDFRNKMKQRLVKQIPFSSICKVPPHFDLPFQLTNIICGTALTLRIFNGDIWENPLEPLNFLVSISHCVNPLNRVQVGSVSNAMNDVIANAIRIESSNVKQFVPLLQDDLQQIFKNKVYILEILYRLYDLLHEGQLEIRDIIDEANEGPIKVKHIENQKALGNIKQKLIFFLSYTKDVLNQEKLDELLHQLKDYKDEKVYNNMVESKIGELEKLSLLL